MIDDWTLPGDGDRWVEYAVGDPQFRGRTVVRVSDDGRATVTSQRGDHGERFEKRVETERLRSLYEQVAANPVGELSPQRDGQPDEALVELTVNGDEWRTTGSFWRHERDREQLAEAFEAVAATVSEGAIQY